MLGSDKEDSAGSCLAGYTKVCWNEGDAGPAVKLQALFFWGCTPPPAKRGWEWLPEVGPLKPWELLRGNGGQEDSPKHLRTGFPGVLAALRPEIAERRQGPSPTCRCVLFGLLSI